MHNVTMPRLVLCALVLALCGCATTRVPPASVAGRPAPPGNGPETKLRPFVIQGKVRASGRTATGLSEFVVYVDAVKSPASTATRSRPAQLASAKQAAVRPPRVQIGLEPGGFAPRVVAVGPGDSVDFVNRDRRYHSAFSVSAARRFDLGSIPPHGKRSLRFDKAGTVRVFCTLHSDSSGYVFVAPSKVFARPDASGSFALPELPAGAYRVRAWHPRLGERSWPVDLTRRGLAIDLRF